MGFGTMIGGETSGAAGFDNSGSPSKQLIRLSSLKISSMSRSSMTRGLRRMLCRITQSHGVSEGCSSPQGAPVCSMTGIYEDDFHRISNSQNRPLFELTRDSPDPNGPVHAIAIGRFF